jgi:hypothetical protein
LLFADDLAVASFTGHGLQKKIDRVDQYCKDWNLCCNLSKCKIIVFKNGGKLKSTERWKVNGQNIEVVDTFNSLGVTLDSTGSWKKQKILAEMKGSQALRTIDKCMHAYTHTRARTRTHTHTHTHIYIYIFISQIHSLHQLHVNMKHLNKYQTTQSTKKNTHTKSQE